jgi:hypothetical protein
VPRKIWQPEGKPVWKKRMLSLLTEPTFHIWNFGQVRRNSDKEEKKVFLSNDSEKLPSIYSVFLDALRDVTWRPAWMPTQVARFLLSQYTKTGENIPSCN